MPYSRHLRAPGSVKSQFLTPGLPRCAAVIELMTQTLKFQEIQPLTEVSEATSPTCRSAPACPGQFSHCRLNLPSRHLALATFQEGCQEFCSGLMVRVVVPRKADVCTRV